MFTFLNRYISSVQFLFECELLKHTAELNQWMCELKRKVFLCNFDALGQILFNSKANKGNVINQYKNYLITSIIRRIKRISIYLECFI